MNRDHVIALVVLCGLLPAPCALGEAWTNQAGQAIHARLVDYQDGQVFLQATNGTTLRMPINVLCAACQKKIRTCRRVHAVPSFVLAAHRDAQAVLARYHSLPENQKSPEALGKAVNMALAVFDGRVPTTEFVRVAEDTREAISRLRHELMGSGPDTPQ